MTFLFVKSEVNKSFIHRVTDGKHLIINGVLCVESVDPGR